MKLSIFTDELGIDLTESISTLRDWGFTHVDLRNRVFGKPAERLDADEMQQLKTMLADHGLKVACLESSLAKVHLPDAQRMQEEQDKLENLIRLADVLDCHIARAFFYWQPKGDTADLQGELAVRSDELQKVMDAAGPLFDRAKAAGLILAFENCGVTVPEVFAVLDELRDDKAFGLAWDCANEYLPGGAPTDEEIRTRIARSHVMHVKASGAVPGLVDVVVPWNKLLTAMAEQGFAGPVSLETHNSDKSVSNLDQSHNLLNVIRDAWPGSDPAPARKATATAKFDFEPVRFVVVGMGMGFGRSKAMRDTPGVELAGVVDLNEQRAKACGEELGVPWTTELKPWLDDDTVDAVFVVTPTGLHHGPVIEALEGGKHVLTTKPMEANVAACDRMIEAADKAGKLLGVDFEFRLNEGAQRKKAMIAQGRLGQILGGTFSLKIQRTMDYFKHNGGWRGTRKLDGGGIMSNQSIHHIDELVYVLGLPQRVCMRMWTQAHDIEAEDLGSALWEYADGAVIQVHGTTSYPQPTWYTNLEIWGKSGAFTTAAAGPFTTPVERWYLDGEWQRKAPAVDLLPWKNSAQNMADAIRTGAPLLCDGREGRKSRAVLDAMYESADNDGKWVTVGDAVAAV